MRYRLSPDERKVSIVVAAMVLAARHPTKPLCRMDVAKEAGCCPSLIFHYFGSMSEVEKVAINQAAAFGDIATLAYALAQGLPGGDASQRAAAATCLA